LRYLLVKISIYFVLLVQQQRSKKNSSFVIILQSFLKNVLIVRNIFSFLKIVIIIGLSHLRLALTQFTHYTSWGGFQDSRRGRLFGKFLFNFIQNVLTLFLFLRRRKYAYVYFKLDWWGSLSYWDHIVFLKMILHVEIDPSSKNKNIISIRETA
jgi:hypothetical protein